MYDFDAQIVDVFSNVLQDGKKNIVILDQSAFYPTSGGQANDTGTLTIQAAALTVESSNEQLTEALERHGRARGIDEVGSLLHLTSNSAIFVDGYDFQNRSSIRES